LHLSQLLLPILFWFVADTQSVVRSIVQSIRRLRFARIAPKHKHRLIAMAVIRGRMQPAVHPAYPSELLPAREHAREPECTVAPMQVPHDQIRPHRQREQEDPARSE
jgi:hypothetical protein